MHQLEVTIKNEFHRRKLYDDNQIDTVESVSLTILFVISKLYLYVMSSLCNATECDTIM